MRSISQPPAGLGAGCYLAGQLGFGGAVWVSGRREKGSSISGVELLLENRIFQHRKSEFTLLQIHSATWRKKGLQRCSRTAVQSEASRGLYCQTFKKVVSFRWRSSRLPEKSVSATVRFTSLSTDRERGGWLRLHMLYSEEKSVREAGI